MDKHMKNEMTNSIPSLMAVLGYIHRNQLGAGSHCIIPYDANLSYFPSYLQQLEMESNGKSVSIKGDCIKSSSVPVVWGLVGTDAQHSFFQSPKRVNFPNLFFSDHQTSVFLLSPATSIFSDPRQVHLIGSPTNKIALPLN